jgi:antitoxin component of RelBE/YafQ-DinJ toxin-antitoxin module
MEKKSLKHLNFLIPSGGDFYDLLTKQKHYFLPKYESPAITQEYLYNVMLERVFTIKDTAIKECHPVKYSTAIDLFDMLKGIIKEKALGFDEANLPDKLWMQKVIYALNPNSSIFKESQEEVILREIPTSISLWT